MVDKRRLDRVITALGEFRQRKSWLNFKCPFHHGDSLNFGVSISRGNYSCFACGVSGTIEDLEKQLRITRTTRYRREGSAAGGPDIAIPPTTPISPGLLKCLSNYSGGSDGRTDAAVGVKVPPDVLEDGFWSRYTPVGRGGIINCRCEEYLTSRGVDPGSVKAGTLEDYPNYVVFPFIDHNNRLVYWQGRAVDRRKPKTINPDESIWTTGKNSVLWGYERIKKNSHVILTEGIFDAVSAEMAVGVPATCLLGSTISREQIILLRNAGVSSVLVMLDGDANSKAVKVATELYDGGVNAFVIMWPSKFELEDPNSLPSEELRNLLRGAVKINQTAGLKLLLEYS